MSYIGNQPTSVAFLTDQFSGTGSQTAFTLSAAPANTASIIVAVSGVLQDPTTYSTSGLTLTFSAAPPSGTGNISVRFLGIPASNIATTAYRTLTEFTATSGQTTFSVPSYTVGYINVYRNGVMLGTADFTATSGTTVVLAAGATAGDLVATESFFVSSVLNAIPAVAGAVNSSYIANDVTINFADGSASTPSITNNGDTNTGIFFPAADSIGFAEGGAEIARFDPLGNLLLGTTGTNSYMDGKITAQSAGTSPVMCAKLDPASANPAQFVYSAWAPFNSADNIFLAFVTETTPNLRGTVDYNRGAGQVRYNTTSDATLKNLIGNADKQKSVDILNTTKIREYAWKEDAEQKPQIGVIAQELYETYKGAVTIGGEDNEGNYKPWGVDKTAFTFHLIAGWQEHQRIIQEQQAIITAMEARLTALENK
jgi:hypothetical protein